MIISIFKYIGIVIISFMTTSLMILFFPFDRKYKIFIWLSSLWSALILLVCGIKVSVKGIENLTSLDKCVVVSNHASMFDIVALFNVFPKIKFMYKKELVKIPVWGWALNLSPHIKVNREKGTDAMRSLNKIVDSFNGGGHVLLFAEGTRTLDGNMQPFKRGAFILASKSGVPIIPLTVNGTFGIKPKNSWKILSSKVELIFHKPIFSTPKTREEEILLMNETHRIILNDYVGVLQ